MNHVLFQDGYLIVEPEGLDKVWAFKAKLTIPVNHIRSLTVASKDQLKADGYWQHLQLRAGGLGLPNKKAGNFMDGTTESFVNISGKDDILFATLQNEHYNYLFLTVRNPAELMSQYQRLTKMAD